jgi:TonB family protein
MRITLIIGIMAWVACSTLPAETNAPVYLGIDAKGVRHESKESAGSAPWMRDLAHAQMPSPVTQRLDFQGVGIFRLTLDPKTGGTRNVEVLRSTGHAALDRSALLALKVWRWKAATWTRVDLPFAFLQGGTVLVFPRYTTLPVPQKK